MRTAAFYIAFYFITKTGLYVMFKDGFDFVFAIWLFGALVTDILHTISFWKKQIE